MTTDGRDRERVLTRAYAENMARKSDALEAAAMIRRVLDATERGDLDATTPKALALVRRLEGAAAAFEESAK